MTRDEKISFVETLTEELKNKSSLYITDVSGLSVDETNKLRRLCYEKGVKLQVVKNILLKRALEKSQKEFEPLFNLLSGPTSIMYSDIGTQPAKLIKTFRATNEKPLLKGAVIENECYIGDEQLEALVQLKSKDEILAEIIQLLKSPIQHIIGALHSGKNKLGGILKTLENKKTL